MICDSIQVLPLSAGCSRLVTKRLHVTRVDMGYDMIIGMDILTELGIEILNSMGSIKWDEVEIPTRPIYLTIEYS